MMIRSTLNGRQARTLRDAERDPFDWCEGPYKRTGPLVSEWLMGVGFVVVIILMMVGIL